MWWHTFPSTMSWHSTGNDYFKTIDTQPELPYISPAKKQYLIKKIKRIFHYPESVALNVLIG
jgi:hypothetical protein